MNSNYTQVKKISMLQAINAKPDDICYCMEDESFYAFKDGSWVKTSNPNDNDENTVSISQYALNQQYIASKDPLTEQELEEKTKLINEWSDDSPTSTYMLYGKEISYFTIFAHKDKYSAPQDFDTIGNGIIECLKELSGNKILIIEQSDDGNAIEIWVKYQGRQTLLYLFNYDLGMVVYGS